MRVLSRSEAFMSVMARRVHPEAAKARAVAAPIPVARVSNCAHFFILLQLPQSSNVRIHIFREILPKPCHGQGQETS